MAFRELSWAEESSGLKCLLFTHTSISTFWNISPRFSWLVWEIQKEMKSAGLFISLTDELWKNKRKPSPLMFSIGNRGRWFLQSPDIRIWSYSPESLFARLCATMHVWKSGKLAKTGSLLRPHQFQKSNSASSSSAASRCLYRLSHFANYFSYPEWYFIVFIH